MYLMKTNQLEISRIEKQYDDQETKRNYKFKFDKKREIEQTNVKS